MSGFKAPPQHDFQSYASLVGKQGDHLARLQRWGSVQCSSTAGFEGLLLPMAEVVPRIADLFVQKLAQCDRGMNVVVDKVHRTSDDYTRTDQATAVDLRNIYPAALPGFPDIGAAGLPNAGNFNDEPVDLKEPPSAEEDTAKNIHHQLMTMRDKLSSGPLATAEKVFKFFTGQSLIELLIEPLVGQYGQLRYLHDAFDQLSDGAYTVAGTLRKGSWALADEWTGEAATAFDSYMFRWSMGVGGLGDAAKVASGVYKDGYDAVVALVYVGLRELDSLISNELKELAEQGAEMAAGDAAIEVVGLGPEDPLADIGAGIFTAYKLYKIYKIIARIVTVINAIEGTYRAIVKAVEGIRHGIDAVVKAFDSPMPSIGSLIDDVEKRGFEFEKGGGWSAPLGASRVALLPPA